MLTIIVLCIFLLLILLTILWYVTQFMYIFYLRNIPGPKPFPVVGNALNFTSTTVFLPKLMEYKRKYGDVYKLFFGFQKPNVVIVDHKLLQNLLGSMEVLDKAVGYKSLHRWLGQGLLTSTGSVWKSHRKIIVPAFHFKILEQFVDVFNKNGNTFIKKLENELTCSSFNIYEYVTFLTLDIICESALGTEIDAQNNSQSEYVKSVKYMCQLVMERQFVPYLEMDFTYQFTKQYRLEQKALDVLHTLTKTVIREKKEKLNSSGDIQEKEDQIGRKRKLAFLDLLLKANLEGAHLTDKEIQEEVDTFMFEGHDTVSSAISFALYNLSIHPEFQQKCFEEVEFLCSSNKNYSFTFQDLHEMKYIEAVAKETLRLFPSVPIYGRTTPQDIKLDHYFFPKGTILLIFAYGIARDEKYFPEPEKFNPDRFLNYTLSNQYPFAYLPFSAGPRNCIGQKFAILEMKSTIAKFLQNYEALPAIPDHQLILSSETTLKSANGIMIRIKRREMNKNSI